MDSLPFDILKCILDIVGDYGNDLLSLYYCSHVCVSWSHAINFYANYVCKDQDISRCKITPNNLKFYSESQYLSCVSFNENTDLDAVLDQCVMPGIGEQLLRIKCVDFPTSETLSGLMPQSLVDFRLSHIHLENVGMCNEIFELFCSKFAPTLSNLYLQNYIPAEKDFSLFSFTQSVSKLLNLRHLDLKDFVLNESSNNDENCSTFLRTIAESCPLIENLSINDYIPLSNENLIEYLSLECTSHLRFLSISSHKVDDCVEGGFLKRIEIFGRNIPPLIIFACGTQITTELCQKYLKPDLFGFRSAADETEKHCHCHNSGRIYNESLQLRSYLQNQLENGKIYLDILPTPPYGSPNEYPFHRSNISDWPPSPPEFDLESSISGGGCGFTSYLHPDYDEYNDFYDDDDPDENDDDDYEYEGDEDFYG
uniref:F-box domain-containing protein n=1 Tax=Romanomermis culicivorax TaxID=13658 RepID=A0A915KB51_ROMCU